MSQEFVQGRSLTVSQFLDLLKESVFGDNRVEMLEGKVWELNPPDPLVATAITVLNNALIGILSDAIHMQTRSFFLAEESVPAPDLYLYFDARGQFQSSFPLAESVLFVIEVADKFTLLKDCWKKGWIYAQNAIPEYWVVNCVDYEVEIYTEPTPPDDHPPRYLTKTVLTLENTAILRVEGQPTVEIPLATLFGE